jgi:hypothetical protein
LVELISRAPIPTELAVAPFPNIDVVVDATDKFGVIELKRNITLSVNELVGVKIIEPGCVVIYSSTPSNTILPPFDEL